mgnify:CR=1 FL=1
MSNNYTTITRHNITVISPTKGVQKVHKFEFDQIFYKHLISSKKKICVFRNYKSHYIPDLEEYCRTFDIVFLEQEGFQEEFIPTSNPYSSKFILVSGDTVFPNIPNTEFIPFDWLRTIVHYSTVNKSLWTKPKKFCLTARMNNPMPWKVDLLKKILHNKNLTWSAGHVHPEIPGSPKTFESEKYGMDHELPSMEQILSWSLLCLETENYDVTEKTYQHLYHLSPTIWHTDKSILYLEQFGFTIRFNGFDYSYLDMPREQKISTLVKQIQSMTAQDFKDFYHQNIKETENNHKLIADMDHWYRLFTPKIQQYL